MIVFTVVYALAYVIAVWKNYALFTYHPVTGALGLGVEKPKDGPAMYWFGWMATAGIVAIGACLIAWLVPGGTHEYYRLEIRSYVARCGRAAGLEVADIAGLKYDPLREQCSLNQDPSVNYLMHLQRRAAQVHA